ncbi:hypothetical protein P4O66_002050 [Electrophorus voltai]|uniref:Uncharacterized protein n=1 Tax=Electrophorus voltai TaxID=2609070 RepID=A0AAD9DSE0_9TELE|nr:hypothetical protein P4O66_002050 [Electrophorus voltai]
MESESTAIVLVPLHNALQGQTASPSSSMMIMAATTASTTIGSAVVNANLVFNNSSPVPSESMALNAVKSLLSSRGANITGPVKVQNITYEKLSDTSYEITFIFSLGISQAVFSTFNELWNFVNNALNTILNEPNDEKFEPQTYTFTVYFNIDFAIEVKGNMNYTFKKNQKTGPITYLIMLQRDLEISDTSYAVIFTFSLSNISMPNSTDLRNSTSSQVKSSINKALNTLVNEPNASPIEPQSSTYTLGSAVVNTRLIFNNSSPIPSESMVLSAVRILLSTRLSNISDSVNVLSDSYEKISDTSYAVIFTFSLSNISMPNSTDLRNSTSSQVKSSINKALNTLVNEPNASPIEPQSSTYTKSSANQIQGNMEYTFQNGDTRIPVSYLNELQILLEISDTSYAVIFTFSLSNISMPNSTDLRNSTSSQVKSSINKALNTLVNEPNASPIEPQSSTYTLGSAVVNTRLIFNNSSPIPSESMVLSAVRILLSTRLSNISDSVKVLSDSYEKISDTSYAVIFTFSLSNISMPNSTELRNSTISQVQSSINKALNTLVNEPNTSPIEPQSSTCTLGSAVVNTRLIFNNSSPIPIESMVLNAVIILLSTRLSNISDSVKVLSDSYEKISDTSYAVIFTFSLSNISMPNSTELRNSTISQVQSSINKALNTLVNEPNTSPIEPQSSTCTKISANQIQGNMEYTFQNGDTRIPVSYLNELQILLGVIRTTPPTANLPLQSTTTPNLLGTVLIYIHVMFKNVGLPTEAQVLAAYALLDPSVRVKRDITISKLNPPVSIQNITYQKMDNSSYAIGFAFKISNVSMAAIKDLRNDTYVLIRNTTNNLMNKILNAQGATPVVFSNTTYTFGKALIYITLVIKNITHIPSENEFLTAYTQLKSSVTTPPEVDSNSYRINFGYMISNVPMATKTELNKETYGLLEQTTNILVSVSHFYALVNNTLIVANAEYVYVPGDINFPSAFLAELLHISDLAPGGACVYCVVAVLLYGGATTEDNLIMSSTQHGMDSFEKKLGAKKY